MLWYILNLLLGRQDESYMDLNRLTNFILKGKKYCWFKDISIKCTL